MEYNEMDYNELYNYDMLIVQFDDTAIDALNALFELIHWDDLAKSWWRLLPDELLDELSQEFRDPIEEK